MKNRQILAQAKIFEIKKNILQQAMTRHQLRNKNYSLHSKETPKYETVKLCKAAYSKPRKLDKKTKISIDLNKLSIAALVEPELHLTQKTQESKTLDYKSSSRYISRTKPQTPAYMHQKPSCPENPEGSRPLSSNEKIYSSKNTKFHTIAITNASSPQGGIEEHTPHSGRTKIDKRNIMNTLSHSHTTTALHKELSSHTYSHTHALTQNPTPRHLLTASSLSQYNSQHHPHQPLHPHHPHHPHQPHPTHAQHQRTPSQTCDSILQLYTHLNSLPNFHNQINTVYVRDTFRDNELFQDPSYLKLFLFLFPNQFKLRKYTSLALSGRCFKEACAHLHQAQFHKAIHAFSADLYKRGSHKVHLFHSLNLAVAQIGAGYLNKALANLAQLQKYFSKNEFILYNKCLCEAFLGRFKEGIKTANSYFLLSFSEQNKLSKDLYRIRAILQFRLQNFVQATQDFETYQKLSKSSLKRLKEESHNLDKSEKKEDRDYIMIEQFIPVKKESEVEPEKYETKTPPDLEKFLDAPLSQVTSVGRNMKNDFLPLISPEVKTGSKIEETGFKSSILSLAQTHDSRKSYSFKRNTGVSSLLSTHTAKPKLKFHTITRTMHERAIEELPTKPLPRTEHQHLELKIQLQNPYKNKPITKASLNMQDHHPQTSEADHNPLEKAPTILTEKRNSALLQLGKISTTNTHEGRIQRQKDKTPIKRHNTHTFTPSERRAEKKKTAPQIHLSKERDLERENRDREEEREKERDNLRGRIKDKEKESREQFYYLDKDKQVRLEKIIGLAPQTDLTEKEQEIILKRRRITKELLGPDYDFDGKQREMEEHNQDRIVSQLVNSKGEAWINQQNVDGPNEKRLFENMEQFASMGVNVRELDNKLDRILHINHNITYYDLQVANGENLMGTTIDTYKKKLSLNEIRFVREQFRDKNIEERDLDTLEQCTSKIGFFARFQEETRKKLLKSSDYIKIPAGEALFHQGDFGDRMYIILRGSISVRIRKAEYGEHPLIITTLPDGCHFGELAIFVAGEGKAKNDRYSEQNKRKASCLACEDTDLLAIPREATQKIILGQIQNKIDTELHFLKTITYFQDIPNFTLTPLVCNLKKMAYRYGECLVKEGEVPKGLFVIISGHCVTCSENLNMRSQKPSKYCRKINDNKQLEESFDLEKIDELNESGYLHERKYKDDNGNFVKDHIIYKHKTIFEFLGPKSTFGGRSVLPSNMMTKQELMAVPPMERKTYVRDPKQVRVSLVSVVANSTIVEVYIIDIQKMTFLPKEIQMKIYQEICNAVEPDCPFSLSNVEKIKKKFREWECYKVCLAQEHLREQYYLRNRDRIMQRDDFPS